MTYLSFSNQNTFLECRYSVDNNNCNYWDYYYDSGSTICYYRQQTVCALESSEVLGKTTELGSHKGWLRPLGRVVEHRCWPRILVLW